MSRGLCPSCGASVDFPANQDASICVSCGTSVNRLDAEDHFQQIKAIARVILGQFREAKAGDRIALEWHMAKIAVAIPLEHKPLVTPATHWLEGGNAIKLIHSQIQLIEITQTGLSLLDSLKP